uniref:MarC family protein n=1 Tax=Phaeovulum sp. TaxID=2934796 RepID=UPI003561773B
MDTVFALTAFVTLFVVVDPIGLAPVFVALTGGMEARARRHIALRAVSIAAVLLTLFGLLGDRLLGGIGITLPAFRIAGGVLLFLTALDMLFERRTQRREGQHPAHADDPSVFPLATPLIAGPGALATMILLTGQAGGWGGVLLVHLVMAAVL